MDTSRPAPLQAVDLLVILKLAALGQPAASVRLVADEIGLSKSAVALSLHRLQALGLRDEAGARRINKLALRECLQHAVRWIAPADIGPSRAGLPTAHAAPPLSSKLTGGDDPRRHPPPPRTYAGESGHAAASARTRRRRARDPKLLVLLALVDAFRIGRARDRQVAAAELGACL